jgi:hypothetical protein
MEERVKFTSFSLTICEMLFLLPGNPNAISSFSVATKGPNEAGTSVPFEGEVRAITFMPFLVIRLWTSVSPKASFNCGAMINAAEFVEEAILLDRAQMCVPLARQ